MNCLKDDKGNFTIEASLVLPIVLLWTLILLFFCLYLYQTAILNQVSTVAAERVAYSWDNSHRDSRSGAFAEDDRDSLYWHLTDDRMLESIFGIGSGGSKKQLDLPLGGSRNGSLPEVKMQTAGSEIPSGLIGEIVYENQIISRKITVNLERMIRLVPLEKILDHDTKQQAYSFAYVVDPVEFIRTVDLARYYGAKFKKSGSGGMEKKEAGDALLLFAK